jgi:hypothetical protein
MAVVVELGLQNGTAVCSDRIRHLRSPQPRFDALVFGSVCDVDVGVDVLFGGRLDLYTGIQSLVITASEKGC